MTMSSTFDVALCLWLACAVGVVSSQIMGGWVDADVKDPEIKEYAKIAVDELAKKSNDLYRMTLIDLHSARTQVVGGINYRFEVKSGTINVLKTEDMPEEYEVTQTQDCTLTLWVRSWENLIKLTDSPCTPLVLVDSSSSSDSSGQDWSKKRMRQKKRKNQKRKVGRKQRSRSRRSTPGYGMPYGRGYGMMGGRYRGMMMSEKEMEEMMGFGDEKHQPKDDVIAAGAKIREAMQKAMQHILPVLQQGVPKLVPLVQNTIPKLAAPKVEAPQEAISKPSAKKVDFLKEFEDFKQKYNKRYSGKQEDKKRLRVFNANMRKAQKLQETEEGTATYGATQFADLTEKEFRLNWVTPKWDTSYDSSLQQAEIPKGKIPSEFDWREHGAVTPVKNQASCGSCWAFSTTGNIEGQWAIRKKKLVSLSEQELVDCDKLDEGCEGGLPSNAYKEIIRLGGLESEKQYPYKAEDEKCDFVRSEARIYINGSLNISSNEADMASWLFKNGPISIGINAMAMQLPSVQLDLLRPVKSHHGKNHRCRFVTSASGPITFQFYMGGVSHPFKFLCNPDELDHGVLIVGYGIHKGWFGKSPYWIVKNSWGEGWGEKGYYLVYRGAGVCGLNKMPTSALVK